MKTRTCSKLRYLLLKTCSHCWAFHRDVLGRTGYGDKKVRRPVRKRSGEKHADNQIRVEEVAGTERGERGEANGKRCTEDKGCDGAGTTLSFAHFRRLGIRADKRVTSF